MEQTTIAKPYANAILEIAAQNNTHSVWHEVLTALVQIASDDLYQAFNSSPNASKDEKTQATIKLLASSLGRDTSEEENALVAILLENSRMNATSAILEMFDVAMNATNDTKAFNVISAYKLTAAEQKQIVKDLESKYNTTVSIDAQIDETLTGGVIIKEGDKVLDLSIKARVDELSTRLSIN